MGRQLSQPRRATPSRNGGQRETLSMIAGRTNRRTSPESRANRRGFFLVLVLIVVVVATMATYSFTDSMIAADRTAYLEADLVQSRSAVDSAIEATRWMLAQPPQQREQMGGVWNNPAFFQAAVVDGSEPDNPVQFSVIAPGLTSDGELGGIRFGLQNESARLNVNALLVLEQNASAVEQLSLLSSGLLSSGESSTAEGGDDAMGNAETGELAVSLLMTLPGMDTATAEAILDWIDQDTTPRDQGCEDEYYRSLPNPYSAANGPLQSVEELLLVRGVTAQRLFGADLNRNGVLDGDEQQRFAASQDTEGVFGWASYLTVHGAEVNKTHGGEFRVDVNQDDLELLYDELQTALGDELWASFIVAYRVGGTSPLAQIGTGGNAAEGEGLAGGGESRGRSGGGSNGNGGQPQAWTADALETVDLTAGGGTELNQLLDLIDAEVTLGEGDRAVTYLSPFTSDPATLVDAWPVLMDQVSSQQADVLPGRLQLNEAPAELLRGLDVIDAEAIEIILEARSTGTAAGVGSVSAADAGQGDRGHETWPLTEGLISVDQMRALLPLVTAGGDVFRAQVVGFHGADGLAVRSEAIIDATTPNPRLVSYRDLTHLGRGFELSVLGSRAMPSSGSQ